MSTIISIVRLLVLFVGFCECYNLSPKFPLITSHSKPNSYFGYSVLLRAPTASAPASVIVGAPKANSSIDLHRQIVEPGAVFSCTLTQSTCKQFLLDPKGNTKHRGSSSMQYHHLKDHGWLGAVVDGDDFTNGLLVTCAPRWTNRFHENYYFMNGLCYSLASTENTDKTAEELMPLLYLALQGFSRPDEIYFFYALAELGFSIHMTKNNTELLLGAPGMLQWKGMVVQYAYDDKYSVAGSFDFKNWDNYNVQIPNPYFTRSIGFDTYFGYAVSSGQFLNTADVWYVGGAPRGNELLGQVLLYEYDKSRNGNPNNPLIIHQNLQGHQLGEYFGSVLLVVDINNDGADDLIVGAPMHSVDDLTEVGRAYYYMSDGKGYVTGYTITGPLKANARFGSAISTIGDTNNDGYKDVVIGAPFYDNGRGAIFIYFGTKTGLSANYQQMIVAEDINANLRGFGASLSRGVDIDENGYNDLAVGAYRSGQVVVIRTKPIVSLSGSITSEIDQYLIDTQIFPVSICLKYSGRRLPPSLNANYTIEADPVLGRIVFIKNHLHLLKGVKACELDEETCETFFVNITKENHNFTTPLEFTLKYDLALPPDEKTFCSTCPVVDSSHQNTQTLTIPFNNGCKSKKICEPELSLVAQFNYNGPSLVIGSRDKLQIFIQIVNSGEPAFNCMFYANLTADVFLEKTPDVCELQENILMCSIANSLQQNTTKYLTLQLDISSLTSQTELTIGMNVTSSGVENDITNNVQTLHLPLTTEKNIQIIGSSKPAEYTYVDSNKLPIINNLTVTHNYIIENTGPSPAGYAQLHFFIPYKVNDIDEPIVQILEPTAYLDDQPIICGTLDPDGFFRGRGDKIDADVQPNFDQLKRKRSIDIVTTESSDIVESLSMTDKYPANRTVLLSCNSSEFHIQCFEVKCISAPLKKTPTYLTVNLQFIANIKIIDELDESKDVIGLSTILELTSDDIISISQVDTVLHGTQKVGNPIIWYIIGILVGIIILALIIYALYKFGFFKRTAHEKLMNERDGILEENGANDSEQEDNL